MPRVFPIVATAVVLVILALAFRPGRPALPAGSASAEALQAPPVFFVENRGQIAAAGDFYAEGADLRIVFGPRGLAVTQYGQPPGPAPAPMRRPGVRVRLEGGQVTRIEPARRPTDTVYLDFVGARPGLRPIGRSRLPTVLSFFNGTRPEWKTGLATYAELVYPDLWPGIDLVYRGERDSVKATFLVRPGADPAAIRLAWRDARSLRAMEDGAVEVQTAVGHFVDSAPLAFQDAKGRRRAVQVRQVLDPAAPSGAAGRAHSGLAPGADSADRQVAVVGQAHQLRFLLGDYDPSRTLVIDPALFVYAGFFGGPAGNRGLGIAVDPSGAAYFCGETETDLGGRDAYIVKVSAEGTRYDYIAYLGGRAGDTCFDVGVDAAGNAYLTGVAGSSVAQGFPATLGPDLSHNGGGDDVLVAKLAADGTDLVYAGYLGGSRFDFGEGIRVAPDGSVFLTGIVQSDENSFPVTVGPDTSHNGDYDAFICHLRPVPDDPGPRANYAYCGYIGGSGQDIGYFCESAGTCGLTSGHVAIDAAGAAYLSGMTTSTEVSFPAGLGMRDLRSPNPVHRGGWDAWAAKVAPDGTGLEWAGFLGGSGQDEGYGAGVDAAGAFYFTGATMSRDFPATVGPDLSFNGGTSDGFVAKVAPEGSRFEYAGFIGGACSGDCGPDTDEMGVGLTVDADGHAYPIGWTYGSGTTFPAVNGPDLSPNGPHVSLPDDDGASGDAWVARVKARPDAEAVLDNYDFIGFIGGALWDGAFWVALDGRGGVFVAGDTGSDATSFPNGGGLAAFESPRRERIGEYDAFVAKITYDPQGPTLTPEPTIEPTATPAGILHLPRVWKGE